MARESVNERLQRIFNSRPYYTGDKGGRVTRAKSVKKPKGSLESPETKLAKLLHESGRKAVALGQVVNKVPGQPFYTWDELTPEAKMGRVLMAKYLLDKRRRVTMKGIFASR